MARTREQTGSVAADMLRSAYDTGQQNKGQVKRDMQQGRERAEEKAGQAKAQSTSTGSTSSTQVIR